MTVSWFEGVSTWSSGVACVQSESPSLGVQGLIQSIRITPETAAELKGTSTKNVFEPNWQSLKKNAKTAGKHEARICLGKTIW